MRPGSSDDRHLLANPVDSYSNASPTNLGRVYVPLPCPLHRVIAAQIFLSCQNTSKYTTDRCVSGERSQFNWAEQADIGWKSVKGNFVREADLGRLQMANKHD